MQKNHLKYLIIPTLVCIFYAILFLVYLCYQIKSADISNIGMQFFLHSMIQTLFFSSIIFIVTLIFTIAYKLTQLTLKNIIYAFLIALALILMLIAKNSFYIYVNQAIYSFIDDRNDYVRTFVNYYYIFYTLIVVLIIMGVSTLYMKFNKHPITTTTNQHICLLYASLFITLVIIKQLSTPTIFFIFKSISLPMFLYTFITGLMIAAIYFIYIYTWTKETLHVNKVTTNYPVKAILSCLLTILLLFIIIFALHMGTLKISNIRLSFSETKKLIKALVIISYLFAAFMFFIIASYSNSPLYRFIHSAYYLLTGIALIITLNLVIPLSYAHAEKIFTAFGYIYGPLMFGISLSLCLTYLCNKLSINLFFKNREIFANR